MSAVIDIMRAANFNCETMGELLTYEEANNGLEIAPILKAATLGRLASVKSLLAEGVDASTRYGDYEISVLDAAAIMGHLEVCRALLEHGVDVNDAPSSGRTALHSTVNYGRANLLVDLIDLLLSAGADINAQTTYGSTPLYFAACCPESDDAAALLLHRGAAKDALNSRGRSPLHCAAQSGHLAATRALLSAGADASLRANCGLKTSPLEIAASCGRVEVVRELVRHGVDLDAAPRDTGLTALHHAASRTSAVVAEVLVEAGASVAAQTFQLETPLHLATERLSLEIMLVLLQHGAPVRALQCHGADRYCEPPLHLAAQKGGMQGAAEAVDLLLRWGSDESEMDIDGNTAADVIGDDLSEDEMQGVPADADLVRKLLTSASTDRAWRRRGLLLLCLARDRTVRRRNTELAGKRQEKKKGKGGGDRETPENRGDLDGVVAWMLEIEQEGFFRTIVGYL